jgi:hypothetical protein
VCSDTAQLEEVGKWKGERGRWKREVRPSSILHPPLSLLIPLLANPSAYEEAPPVLMFITLALMIVPLGLMGLWTLYGLWGALRALQGADFKYLVVCRMLKR